MLVIPDPYPNDTDISNFIFGNDYWKVKEISLPLNPVTAIEILSSVKNQFNPDCIVGIAGGCHFLNEIQDVPCILVNPSYTLSGSLETQMDYQVEFEPNKNLWKVSNNDISIYNEREANLKPYGKNCLVVDDEDWLSALPEAFDDLETVILPIFLLPMTWMSTFLLPLAKEYIQKCEKCKKCTKSNECFECRWGFSKYAQLKFLDE